ncbi:PTS glucose transporter subunit IIA [Enterococcus lactis]|uniref:PTS glucose transporter subunit IIA n=1 Tax=Enterococcus lactis TaxID=357441 RepID=UPI0039A48FD4
MILYQWEEKDLHKKVTTNQKVRKGDILGAFDRSMIEKEGLDDTTMIIVTNTSDYSEVNIVAENTVTEGTDLLEIK